MLIGGSCTKTVEPAGCLDAASMLEKVQMPPFNAWHPEMLAMSKGQET
jgi:hypothetical protein